MPKTRMKLIVEAVQMLKDGAADDAVRGHVLQHGDEDVDAEEVLQAARNRLKQSPARADVPEDRPPKLPLRCWTILRTLPVILLMAASGILAFVVAWALGRSGQVLFYFSGGFGLLLLAWVVFNPLYIELTERAVTLRWLLWRRVIGKNHVRSVQVDMQTVESKQKFKGIHLYSTFTTWYWIEITAGDGRRLRVRVSGDTPSKVRGWARMIGIGTRLNELEDRVLVYKADPDLDLDL